MGSAKAAVVGIGEVPSGRFAERTEIEAAVAVARDAIRDAGLSPRDVDVVMPTGALASRHFNVDLIFSRLCEELGMLRSAKMNVQVMAGGGSSSSLLAVAEGAMKVLPVTFPPGRARLPTRPSATGSAMLRPTIGILWVTRCAASAADVPPAEITSTLSCTSCSAAARNASRSLPANRSSIWI
jgi:hypothetical protein